MALHFRSSFGPDARPRRHFLTRAEIIEAAAAILERDGYDGLNMRSIAEELGVKATALYRYVGSRRDLDDILFDHLMAGCTPAVEGEDWRDDLRTIALAWRARLIGKRDATRIALEQVSIGPNLLPLMEASFAALRRSGLPDRDALEAYQTCTLFVHSFARAEAAYREVTSRRENEAALATSPQQGWVAAYPLVFAFRELMLAPPDFDYRFAFGLDTLLAGIERRVAEVGGRAGEHPRGSFPRL
ncbi:MAG: TetR/AcrR family transcriptional regulator C-terminal domain-containing protein [Caulobacterales bacterium]